MDPRRFLTLPVALLALSGCATLDRLEADRADVAEMSASAPPEPAPAPRVVSMAPIPNPPEPAAKPARDASALAAPSAATEAEATEAAAVAPAKPPSAEPAPAARRRATRERARPAASAASGRTAIAEANAQARTASAADAFEGGVQVFGWEPGRLYEVWTAPLRVTTLTLAPGETVTAKAAGDTVRWQIGETTSGTGADQRAHVLVKPLEAGLETNLLLTTSERVYMVLLRSGSGEAFNAAVAWRYPADLAPRLPAPEPAAALGAVRPDPDRLDGAYRIEPQFRFGRGPPAWTPVSAFNDGARTFIALPPEAAVDEAPVLFVLAPDGEAQVVNYRQHGSMLVVDRVFERAELRLGDRRPQVVRISRLSGTKRR